MKNQIQHGMGTLPVGIAIVLCAASCVNQVGNEPASSTSTGNIPITFTSTIKKAVTKVADGAFESGDRAGLFAVIPPDKLGDARYIDNLCLSYGSGNTLHPDKEVFYPEDNGTLDFYAYYPYKTAGLEKGGSSMDVSVFADQSGDADYEGSDFLLASTTGVESSAEPVPLTFEHRLAKINFSLLPQEGAEAEGIVASNPVLILTGLKAEASLDFHTDAFTYGENETDIIPHGTWAEDSQGYVSGKSCIVIPQELEDGMEVMLEWNGRQYACPVELAKIESDTEITIHIKAIESEEEALAGIVGSIKVWGASETLDTESQNSLESVCVTALSFETSNIYHIYHLGKTVAEVCKEYLYDETGSNPIDARAIVLYPVSGEQADLSRGAVLQLLDTPGAVHGGTVSWNTADNTFTYTPGTSLPVEHFYIDADGTPTLTKPETPMKVSVSSYLLRDNRSELHTYPVVKVGTQYWMRENLSATCYNDGEEIPLQTALGQGAGYYQLQSDESIHLYNGEAILTGKLAPHGWRVPDENDWALLKTYVHNDASKIKGGEWYSMDNEPSPVTGETGLDITPDGMFSPTQGYVNYTHCAVLWTAEKSGQVLGEHSIYLNYDSDEIAIQVNKVNDTYIAASLRCIKE